MVAFSVQATKAHVLRFAEAVSSLLWRRLSEQKETTHYGYPGYQIMAKLSIGFERTVSLLSYKGNLLLLPLSLGLCL